MVTTERTTIAEAARLVGVNQWNLRYWVKLANLPTTRLGAYRLVDLDAVRRLVESKKRA